jgi:hypothetical protein
MSAQNIVLIDNLRVHSLTPGFLTLGGYQAKPRVTNAYKPTPLILPTHTIYYLAASLNIPNQRAIIFASAMSEFYPLKGAMPSAMAMATAMISMLNNVLNPIDIIGHGITETSLRQARISPHIRAFTRSEKIRELANTPSVRRFLGMFDGHNLELFLHHADQPLIMMGTLLLTIGKQVNSEGYIGWMNNRVRSYTAALGILDEYCVWTSGQYPPQMALAAINAFMSASFDLRRRIFCCCLAACRNPDRSAAIFHTVVQLLQGLEMNNLLMISNYIFNKYPELLRIRALRDNLNAVNTAMTYLTTIPEDNIMYVKILQP